MLCRKKIFVLYLVLAVTFLGWSTLHAEGGTIRGWVQAADGTKLAGVAVWINNAALKTVTDKNGNYTLVVKKPGPVLVTAFIDGFDMAIEPVKVVEGRIHIANFTLKTEELSYEITVTQEVPKLMSASENIGVVSVKPEQVAALPTLGEQDIFRSIQLMPGVGGSNESSAGLYVRGGRPDQNLISYDGFTIYHVDHFFGIFSAFNANAISDVKLFKGGFESRYGGRLSSVMELTGKNGNQEQFKAGAGINFLSYNAYTEIPLGDKGSMFIAGRKSFRSSLYDKILDQYSDTVEAGPAAPAGGGGRGAGKFAAMFDSEPASFFYDLNAKAVYKPSAKDVLSLSIYNGMDDLDNSRDIEIPSFMADRAADRGFNIDVQGNYTDVTDWGNTGVSLNWLRQWNDAFTTRAVVAFSRYFNDRDLDNSMKIIRTTETETEEEDAGVVRDISRVTDEYNRLNDWTFKLANTLTFGSAHRLEFGAQVTANRVDYSYSTLNFRRIDEEQEAPAPTTMLDIGNNGTQFTGYVQDTFTLFRRLTLTPGFRATYFDLTGETYLEPRFSLILDVSQRLKFKAAWGKYHQFANNLVREDILQGDQDFWMLSDGVHVPVGSSVHYIAGISYETKGFLFDIEGYYKDLKGISEYAYRPEPGMPPGMAGTVNYMDYFYQGNGTAKGIEVLLQKKYGWYTGWMCYTLRKVEYQFPEFSAGTFPASHDVTHEFKWVNCVKWRNWTLAATWIYATGRPYTEPLSASQEVFYDEERNREIVINLIDFGPKNGARLPAYHRLDLSATLDLKVGKFDAKVGLSVFNAYNRQNVWRKEYDIAENELIETDINYMGVTPSLRPPELHVLNKRRRRLLVVDFP